MNHIAVNERLNPQEKAYARDGDRMNEFDFINFEPITKGWSEDKKYCVTKADGTKYLLRISPIERFEKEKNCLR